MRPQAHRQTLMLLMTLAAPTAFGQVQSVDTPATVRLGDHPAVVIQRLQRSAGYDHPSKFYLHPAHLYLLSASPDELERMRLAAQAARVDAMPDEPDTRPATLAHR